MADEVLVFDAAGSAIGGGDPGSPLTIAFGASPYGVTECSYPAPPQIALWASSADTEGELLAGARYGNRTITLKFNMVDSAGTLLAALQAKFAKVQQEGGTLKRTMVNGAIRIYDIRAADGWDPAYNFAYYISDLVEVSMTLQARPFSRGVEVDMGDTVETALPVLTKTVAGIAGDAPGLGRLVIDEDQAQLQRTVIWGIESRDYSAAGTAALFYPASALSGVFASPAVGPAGAYGAGSNTQLDGSLAVTYRQQWAYSGTHTGLFRIIGRFWVPTSNTGTVTVQMFSQLRLSPMVYYDAVPIDPVNEGTWVLIDGGLVSAPRPTKGTQSLYVSVRALSTVAGDDLYTNWIALFPADEGFGVVTSSGTGADVVNPLSPGASLQIEHEQVVGNEVAGNVWGRPNSYQGSYLKIPPSGAENRTVRIIVKASRGRILNMDPVVTNVADAGIDDISARLFVTPRFLT